MKIQVLEFGASDSPKHSTTSGKAKCLVEELGWAVRLSKRLIQLTIPKTWAVVKAFLATSKEERLAAERKRAEAQDRLCRVRSRMAFPEGAQYGFSRWPSVDQRTLGIFKLQPAADRG
jgi:hypothetical protein